VWYKYMYVNIALTVVPVQPQTLSAFYAKSSSHSLAALTTDWYSECVQDHFQIIINSSQNQNIPCPKYHKNPRVTFCFSYYANKRTDMDKTLPLPTPSKGNKLISLAVDSANWER